MRALSGIPFAEIDSDEPAWRHERRHQTLDDEHREVARWEQREQGGRRRHPPPSAAPAYAYAAPTPAPVSRATLPRYAAGAWAKAQRRSCWPTRGRYARSFENALARADQVMADVRFLVADSLMLRRPAGALHGAQGNSHLRFAARAARSSTARR